MLGGKHRQNVLPEFVNLLKGLFGINKKKLGKRIKIEGWIYRTLDRRAGVTSHSRDLRGRSGPVTVMVVVMVMSII